MRRDPVEETAAYRAVVADVERSVDETLFEFGMSSDRIGYCHAFWPLKQAFLRDDHGIDWKTPSEMNPTILFD